ncbi:hypothetical protein Dimus_019602 [Dionaea muscipula]
MVTQDPKKSPDCPKNPTKQQFKRAENSQNCDDNGDISSLLTPRFRSVAAMAGWDEDALLVASLIVEDTPDRDLKTKQGRPDSSNSNRKRRVQRRNTDSVPVVVLNLDDEESALDRGGWSEKKTKCEEKNVEEENVAAPAEQCSSSSSSGCNLMPPSCMERLREELSCAVCLEICYEPSTTPCGHSFCKKCLRSAADKCGKRCPKCRQLISGKSSYTINTVLWNTIQLLFPTEVEARKAAAAAGGAGCVREQATSQRRAPRRAANDEAAAVSLSRRINNALPSQDEDAALALRLQREEFMGVIRIGSAEQQNSSSSTLLARSNLRAMASRAINLRLRSRPTHFFF